MVCHDAHAGLLRQALTATATQVECVVLVDNGSGQAALAATAAAEIRGLELIRLPANVGLAAAQNVGIRSARARGCKFILLLDHDSVPETGMVEALVRAYDRLVTQGHRVAAVGPVFVERKDALAARFVQFRWLWVSRRGCGPGRTSAPADFLISSGTLLPCDALDDIGLMDDSLFIEHVDTEWCFRALRRGWRLFGVCDARLQHDRGESLIRFWFGQWRSAPLHRPVRNYYLIRNGARLLATGAGPARSLLPQVAKLCLAFAMYSLVGPQRGERMRLMLRGLRDGLSGRLGPLDGA